MRKNNSGKIVAGELDRNWSKAVKKREAVLLVTLHGKILKASPAACKVFTMTENEIKSRSFKTLLDSSIFNFIDVAGSLKKQVKFSDEFMLLKKGGKKFHGKISAEFFGHTNGRGVILIRVRDDLNKKDFKRTSRVHENNKRGTGFKINQSIEEERNFLNALLNGLPGIFYLFDRNLNLLKWNQNVETITGYPPEEVKKMNPLNLFPEDQRELVKEKVEEVFSKGYSSVEASFISKDGVLRPFFFNGLKIMYNFEECLIGVGIDISPRKAAEEALMRNERLLRIFIEHSPAPISMFDKEMRYIAVSKRVLTELNTTEGNIIGRSHYEVFPRISDRWKEIHKRCLKGAVEKCDEDEFVRLNGEIEWIRWEIRPWYEREDEIGGIIIFSEVITERKKAEQERLSLIKRLLESEEMMRKSTSERLHDQVGQNLTALNINLSYLLTNLPENLAGSEIEKKIKVSLDELSETGSCIRDIMVDLQPPVLVTYGLNAALNWGLNKFADRNNFNIVYCGKDLAQRLPLNTELSIFRVFQEILHNIAKHSRAKNISVYFEETDMIVKLQVEDDGIGFSLADVQQQKEKSSLGILSMTERISIIGGKLDIFSEAGRGTKVIITLKK